VGKMQKNGLFVKMKREELKIKELQQLGLQPLLIYLE
jgi:hypothetical protein